MPRTLSILAWATLATASAFAGEHGRDAAGSELAGLLGAESAPGFRRAIEPRAFAFPEDHGPHPEFRNEWWYVTGNLDADDGSRFGFELTIFRFALAPDAPASPSAWRTNQVYVAHFAITDAARSRFHAAERYARGAVGLAGARAEPFRVWLGDWEIGTLGATDAGERWRLAAGGDGFSIDVRLDALKSPVLNGVDGLSQKSGERGNASYYYSMPRWDTVGTITIADDQYAVTGLSWLDREWSTSALAPDQRGWDWFALQFTDGTDLMFYNLRGTDGTQDPASAGTWIAADGTSRYLARDDVEIDVTGTWRSPAGGTYPAAWNVRIPALDLDVSIRPVIPDQELFTIVRYWEGAVDVAGTREGRALEGRGYVELTGYADAGAAAADP